LAEHIFDLLVCCFVSVVRIVKKRVVFRGFFGFLRKIKFVYSGRNYRYFVCSILQESIKFNCCFSEILVTTAREDYA